MNDSSLPRFAHRVVEWVVPDPISRAGLVGDLEERYRSRAEKSAVAKSAWLAGELLAIGYHYGMKGGGMDALGKDLTFALRGMARRPGFHALVILTLALGIGANAAIFSVVNTLIVEPLPFDDSDRLVIINEIEESGFTASVSFPNYRDWKRSESFDRFSLFLPSNRALETEDGTTMLEVGWVGGGFFETLGTEPVVGRYFSEAESEAGAERLVVLDYRTWRDRFGADPTLVGRPIRLGGEPFVVVGVTPASFVLQDETAAYLPIGVVYDRLPWDDRRTSVGASVLARLAPGVTIDRASDDLRSMVQGIRAETGEDADFANLTPLRSWFLGDAGRQSMMLMAAVALMLLVACANVANLLVVASERRAGEMALRSALGASKSRVYRQLLTESLVVAVIGGIAGLALAYLGLGALVALVADVLPAGFADRIEIDGRVLGFVAGITVATAVLAGFMPALRSARAELADRLRTTVAGNVGRGGSGRRILVASEVALSMVLLVGAGLLIETLSRLQSVDKGFDGEGVLTFRVGTRPGGYESREAWYGFLDQMREEIGALPGVTSVDASNIFPLSGNSWEMLYKDEQTPPDERGESVLLTMVSPSFHETYGIEILAGRGFEDADRWGTEPVAIVDETLAAARWPGESPLGQRITFEQQRGPDGEMVDFWRTVVGVAGHVRHYELASPSRIEVYTPIAQSVAWEFTSFVSVRASTDVMALLPSIRGVVSEIEPAAPLYRIRAMDDVIAQELGPQRAMRELLTAMAVLTLLLGCVGIYSVVSHGTTLRLKELGLRIALGGAPSRIMAMVLKDSVVPIAAGVAAGVLGAMLLGRALRAVLYEVGPTDPFVLGSAAAILFVVATFSAWLPAQKAARVDPQSVLRAE